MSFIQLKGLNDVREKKPAPEGGYPLCVTNAKLTEKEGKKNVQLILEIEGTDEDYANIFHYLALPRGEDPAKDQTMMLMIKRFLTQFGVPTEDGFDIEALVGCRSDCMLKQDMYEGNVKNVIQLDRLPAESDE